MHKRRPAGITALAIFSALSAVISSTSALSLVWRHGPLEPMWRINPRALTGFVAMGVWAPRLLVVVGVGCAATAIGLWQCRRWAHRLALVGLATNLVGDVTSSVLGTDRRAVFGIPIALALMAYLLRPTVRSVFARSEQSAAHELSA